jgi:hypothetical protein
MGTYQLDGIDLDPQPVEHDWGDYPNYQGSDGNGAPFYAKYSVLRLRCPLDLAQGHDWFQWADGASHTLTAPPPGRRTSTFTDYTTVYVREVKEGVVVNKTGTRGVEMTIQHIEV